VEVKGSAPIAVMAGLLLDEYVIITQSGEVRDYKALG
jgi:hypothetical protein